MDEAAPHPSAVDVADREPIFVVPLEHERKALVAGGVPADRISTCGPGREGVCRWADRHPGLSRPVILAGLAGGLTEELETGEVVVVDGVIDNHGRTVVPPLASAMTAPGRRGRVATAGRLVASQEAKLALGRSTGAAIVDQESEHFAEIARSKGWVWGVMRVVADTATEAVPTALERFVDHEGRTRLRNVAGEIFQRPSLLPVLRRINQRSRSALSNLARSIRELSIDPAELTEPPRHAGRTDRVGPKQVLVFGGSFDPPHRGHIDLAFEAARRLDCDQVVFVPARVNPLKQDTPPCPGDDRFAMLKAALLARKAAGTEPRIRTRISRLEIDRDGPSFMIDTLRELHRTLAIEPEDPEDGPPIRPRLRLLIGSDQALEFDRWKDWRAILELAPPAVMPRPPETRTTLAAAYRERFPSNLASRWATWTLDLPTTGVSSTEVRERMLGNENVEELLPDGVLQVIRERGLYRPTPPHDSAPGRF
ncbi:MAG: nicotinate (nicotinamide) nucleotide adenylyltransferase [Phycisphaerae bacterium]|nr:nicotinate (nicotinamide) nucleotide adenylyltransferase [Phycisphaerae bacterium]